MFFYGDLFYFMFFYGFKYRNLQWDKIGVRRLSNDLLHFVSLSSGGGWACLPDSGNRRQCQVSGGLLWGENQDCEKAGESKGNCFWIAFRHRCTNLVNSALKDVGEGGIEVALSLVDYSFDSLLGKGTSYIKLY